MTFPETQTILDGVNVPNATIDDIVTVLNLRDVWKFVLSSVEKDLDIQYICKINEYVSRNESLAWGTLRNGTVGISGTDYRPDVPQEKNVKTELEAIINGKMSDTLKAIEVFLYIVYRQLFRDGNKRTATLAANKILIMNGAGILQIKESEVMNFNILLHEYYGSGDKSKLLEFLYEKCIFGMA